MNVLMAADNGRPKIAELRPGWKTGVMSSRVIVMTDQCAYEVPDLPKFTCGEWHRKGLTGHQLHVCTEFIDALIKEGLVTP
jgi:hypothetical protein